MHPIEKALQQLSEITIFSANAIFWVPTPKDCILPTFDGANFTGNLYKFKDIIQSN